MKNKNKKSIKMQLGVTRERQKSQGYFDGRFVERSERDKTKYNRKPKHKGLNNSEGDE